MARMCPREPAEHTRSEGEREVFSLIKTELPNSWSALHSLGMVTHPRKPWAEIDFVLIGPTGVYCLEVKGQRVARRDGQWIFTNRHGEENTHREGPFHQAAGASAALRAYLVRRQPSLAKIAVGYGVVLPDSSLEAEGPDIERAVLFEATDVERGFDAYIDRLTRYWYPRVKAVTGKTPVGLSQQEVQTILALLRPDFDGIPSLRAQAGVVTRELLRLTAEQYRVLDGLAENPRVFVRGGAGTGKTLLAIEEARRQSKLGHRVLFCCFNKNLAHFVRDEIGDSVTCTTLHSLMASLVAAEHLEADLPAASKSDLFSIFYPELALRILRSAGRRRFDVLIVDESQDLLRDDYLDVLSELVVDGLANGQWRMFFDPLQNIYQGTATSSLTRIHKLNPTHYQLTMNCRNTAPIATTTGLLADVDLGETLVAEGPETRIIWYSGQPEQSAVLKTEIDRLVAGGIDVADIVLLSPRAYDSSAARTLAGYRITESTQPRHGSIRFSSVGGFKGLEATAVVLTDVERLNTSDAHSTLYVGTSRACVFLSVLIDRTATKEYETLAAKLGSRLAQAS